MFWGDLRNELRQRGNLCWPTQFDAAFGSGFDLQRIAFLQLGFLNHWLGNAYGQTVTPFNHLRFHKRSSFQLYTVYPIVATLSRQNRSWGKTTRITFET